VGELTPHVVEIAKIAADPRNARTHGERNLSAIAASLETFGQRRPLICARDDAGGLVVVAGNGTLEAARSLGWEELAVTEVPADWDADKARAYAIADNRTAELADWDQVVLTKALLELDDVGYESALLGFDTEITPAVIEDEAPEPPEVPITEPGDMWTLGEHRLLCGDATSPGDLSRLMGEQSAAMMFTDPPWNVAIGQDSNPKHRQRTGLANDSLPPEQFQAFLDAFVVAATPHIAGDVYCVLGASEWPRLDATLRTHGYHWSATVIWVKDSFVLGRSKYHRRYEPIWYGWKDSGASSFCDRRDLDDVWEIPRPRRSEEHPTMKPVALVARSIANSSRSGDLVLDPFLGSGTTLIAAEQLGRVCRGLELDPGYCDVIVARWEKFTGHTAVVQHGER
jgi:DNA modification methylase